MLKKGKARKADSGTANPIFSWTRQSRVGTATWELQTEGSAGGTQAEGTRAVQEQGAVQRSGELWAAWGWRWGVGEQLYSSGLISQSRGEQ